MRFKAKIRNALSATGNTELLVKELNKMLVDAKNVEYKDQIYYALAELDVKNPTFLQQKLIIQIPYVGRLKMIVKRVSATND